MPSVFKKFPQSVQHNYDSRKGLGYGQVANKFHKPRISASSYPYTDSDFLEDEDFNDPESEVSIGKKLLKYYYSDFFNKKSADPFYFAAGNTKLSDCFYRIDSVLLEVEALGDSMSSVPAARNTRSAGMGSANYLTVGNFKRTGDTRGFSSPPPPISDDQDEDEQEFYDLFDFSEILKRSLGE